MYGSDENSSILKTGLVCFPKSFRSRPKERAPASTPISRIQRLRPTSLPFAMSWRSPTAPTIASAERSSFSPLQPTAPARARARRKEVPLPESWVAPSRPARWGFMWCSTPDPWGRWWSATTADRPIPTISDCIPDPRSVKMTRSGPRSAISSRAGRSSCLKKRVFRSTPARSRAAEIIPAEVRPSASTWEATTTSFWRLINEAALSEIRARADSSNPNSGFPAAIPPPSGLLSLVLFAPHQISNPSNLRHRDEFCRSVPPGCLSWMIDQDF